MRNTSSPSETLDAIRQNAVQQRARLNELPALIEAALKQDNKRVAQSLRTEKSHLEEYVPILEAQAHLVSVENYRAQIIRCEQEILEAEVALQIATQLSHAAVRHFESPPKGADGAETKVGAAELATRLATAEMHTTRHNLEVARLKLAQLRVNSSFQQEQPENMV